MYRNFRLYGLVHDPLSFKATVDSTVIQGFKTVTVTHELTMPLDTGVWFMECGKAPLSIEQLAAQWFSENQNIVKGVLRNAKVRACGWV